MVVGKSISLKFNWKFIVFVGLFLSAIFLVLVVTPCQADYDSHADRLIRIITINEVNPGNMTDAESDTYFKNVNQLLAVNGKPINQKFATDVHVAQNSANGILILGSIWDDCYINQTIPITGMYFDGYNKSPIVGANISFHITDDNAFDLNLYANTDSNGFASVDFSPQAAAFYHIEASVVGEIGNLAYGHLWVEPFVHSFKNYIFPANTIQTVKYTLIDKDLNPIDNLVNFNFGSVNENILPVNGTIEYSINSSNTGQVIELNNSFSGFVYPVDYIVDITNRDVFALPGTNIPYFMRVYDTDDTPVPNTNFTIYVEWRDEYWNLFDVTIFNVTTNDYGLSEFEISVPSGFFDGMIYITRQSDFKNGPCEDINCILGWIGNPLIYGGVNGFDFDIELSDWEPNYNEQVTITLRLHNSSIYYSNIPVYLNVDGNSVKLITDSNGEASFTFSPPPTFGTHMIYAMADIPDEGGLWISNSGFFVSPADPYIDLSLNGNVVDINVNMIDNSHNLIPNAPAVLEFVRTPTNHWHYIYDDILSKYIKPVSGTYSEQITLNKYGRYEGYVGWGYYDWYDILFYTPFEYSTNLDSTFSSGQENLIYINIMENGVPLTSGNVYLKGYSSEEQYDYNFHDFAPIDLNGNATLSFSPQPNDEWVYIRIGVSTENETYDLLDKMIELEGPPEPPNVTTTTPANLATNVEIDTNITATFSEPMNYSTLNNNTVKVYTQDRIAGETFEDTNALWNPSNFLGFKLAEELSVFPGIDNRTIPDGQLMYSTKYLLRDYQVYTNEGIEVERSGKYNAIGWMGEEYVTIQNTSSKWIISRSIFEQNSNDVKTMQQGDTWYIGDGYSFELHELDVDGNDAWVFLYNSNLENNQVCQNQSACVFSMDLGAADDSPIFVTYLDKVNTTHIELKYTWVISKNTTVIQNNEKFDDFVIKTYHDRIVIENDEDIGLPMSGTVPLFDDFMLEADEAPNLRYRLIHQTEQTVKGDISYDSASRTVTFNPISNLTNDTIYESCITTGAENLAGIGLTEDYTWTFETTNYTPGDIPQITDFKIEPNTSVSINNPAIASAYITDADLNSVYFQLYDNNGLIDTNNIMLWWYQNESGINGNYSTPPWYANAWSVTNETIQEVVTSGHPADCPDNVILFGIFKKNNTADTKEAFLWFNQTTGNLTNITRNDVYRTPLIIENNTSVFKIFNFKLAIFPFVEGPTFTLHTIGDMNNPQIVPIPVPTGKYQALVTANDTAGNVNVAFADIEVDNTPPNIIITSPANNSILNSPVITILGNVTDDFGIICYSFDHVCQEDIYFGGDFFEPPLPTSITINQTITLCEGWNHLSYSYVDESGNSCEALIVITLDTIQPNATAIVEYQNGSAANNGSTITLNVSANDNLGGSGINNVTVDVSGINASGLITLNKNGDYWIGTVVVTAPDGNHSVNITVTDNASNVNFTEINVTMDNTPPGVINVMAQPDLVNISGTVGITASICGDTENDIENVSVEIIYPNGSHSIYQMNSTNQNSISSMISGGGGYGCTDYHINFTNTAKPGRYNVTIIANDITGNTNDTQKTSFLVAHTYTNTTIITNANNSTFIDASSVNVTLELFTNDSIMGSINITCSKVNITNQFEEPCLGIYIRINACTNFSNDNYSNLSWALIKVFYTNEDVVNNNLDQNSLCLYWYNESSGNWIKLEANSPPWVYGSGVDTANNFVWANVSHFSDYAIGGELEQEIVPPDNGGGGGGGGSTGEAFENIVCSETDRQNLFLNSTVSYSFDQECNIVQYVNFTSLTSSGRIAAKVEILNNTSTLVDHAPPNIVYRNLNIWVKTAGWATERNIADASVVFTVEKSWINENNIDESSIALYRYSGDTWYELITRKISEDANSLQFEAETLRFSPFAVTGKESLVEPGGEGIIVQPAVTAEKTPVPAATEKKGVPGFKISIGLSVLLIAVQLLRRKK